MELYVPRKTGEHYIYDRYDAAADSPVEFNNIRMCTPLKEFLLPVCELVAASHELSGSKDIKPFAQSGFDLNVSKVRDGFIIEAGSDRGKDFIEKHSGLFAEVPKALLAERDENKGRGAKTA